MLPPQPHPRGCAGSFALNQQRSQSTGHSTNRKASSASSFAIVYLALLVLLALVSGASALFPASTVAIPLSVAEQEADLAAELRRLPAATPAVLATASAVLAHGNGDAAERRSAAAPTREAMLHQWSSFLLESLAVARRSPSKPKTVSNNFVNKNNNYKQKKAAAVKNINAALNNNMFPPISGHFQPRKWAFSSSSVTPHPPSRLSATQNSNIYNYDANKLSARYKEREQGLPPSFLSTQSTAGAPKTIDSSNPSLPDNEIPAGSTTPPPGGSQAPKLTEGDQAPTASVGNGVGQFAEAEGAMPPLGYFMQTPECDAAMRVWMELCAFASPEGKKSLYWHGKNDTHFPPRQPKLAEPAGTPIGTPVAVIDPNTGEVKQAGIMSTVEDLTSAEYIGNMITNNNAEAELGENSYAKQQERLFKNGTIGANAGKDGAAAGGAAAGGSDAGTGAGAGAGAGKG